MNTGSNLFTLGQGEGVAETLLEFGCAHGIRTERKSLPSKINGLPAESVGLQTLSLRHSPSQRIEHEWRIGLTPVICLMFRPVGGISARHLGIVDDTDLCLGERSAKPYREDRPGRGIAQQSDRVT